MQRITSNQAPKAIGPYVHATESNNTIFISGQIGLDPSTNLLVEGIENQTRQTLDNLRNILQSSDSDFDHVLKVNIYLKDLSHFSEVNEIYRDCFEDKYPARMVVGASELPMNSLIEMDAVAQTRFE